MSESEKQPTPKPIDKVMPDQNLIMVYNQQSPQAKQTSINAALDEPNSNENQKESRGFIKSFVRKFFKRDPQSK